MPILIDQLCAAADLIYIYPISDKTPQQQYTAEDQYLGTIVAKMMETGRRVHLVGATIHGLTAQDKEQICSHYTSKGAKALTWRHHKKETRIDLLTGEQNISTEEEP